MNLKKLGKTLSITGISGTNYIFEVYEIRKNTKNLSEICSDLNDISAIYMFTKREKRNGKYIHNKIYCGKSIDISSRFYNHKDEILTEYDANCINIHQCNKNNLYEIETDILMENKFSCNKRNNS